MPQAVTLEEAWSLFKETDLKFQEMVREKRERRAESERQDRQERKRRAEAARKWEETKRVVKEVSQQIGQLGSRWREFLEGLVSPACETLFAQRGIPVHQVHQRVRAKLSGNRHMEIDLLAVNSDVVVLVEVKSKLKGDDMRDHLIRLAEFREFFPRYAGCRVMGALAGIVIEESVDRYAMNEGMFVIVQSGESVVLANAPDFTPRAW